MYLGMGAPRNSSNYAKERTWSDTKKVSTIKLDWACSATAQGAAKLRMRCRRPTNYVYPYLVTKSRKQRRIEEISGTRLILYRAVMTYKSSESRPENIPKNNSLENILKMRKGNGGVPVWV